MDDCAIEHDRSASIATTCNAVDVLVHMRGENEGNQERFRTRDQVVLRGKKYLNVLHVGNINGGVVGSLAV
jgi:hypothetical protein